MTTLFGHSPPLALVFSEVKDGAAYDQNRKYLPKALCIGFPKYKIHNTQKLLSYTYGRSSTSFTSGIRMRYMKVHVQIYFMDLKKQSMGLNMSCLLFTEQPNINFHTHYTVSRMIYSLLSNICSRNGV